MTILLGNALLVFALLLCLLQMRFLRAWQGKGSLGRLSFTGMQEVLFGLITAAFGVLIYAFIVTDLSLLLVFQHSSALKPLLYRITGSWGNHEGSLLLFSWILSVVLMVFSTQAKEALGKTALATGNAVLLLFLLYVATYSNPFAPNPYDVAMGMGLNPLLQDIALAIHPPLLYVGYAALAVPYALAIAVLLQRDSQMVWAPLMHSWSAVSLGFLTVGIGLGSWWAYRELGWGGYWFWDPVENASLLPWLAGVALFHSSLVVKKRKQFPVWTLSLAIASFAMALIGFFLVRSGILSSVHSFASAPERGLFLLGIFALLAGGGFLLFALRAPQIIREQGVGLFTRTSFLYLNNIFFLTLVFTVLLGVIYPILSQVMAEKPISVGGPYYNTVFNGIALVALLFMIIAPLSHWTQPLALRSFLRTHTAPLLVSAVLLLLLLFTPITAAPYSFIGSWLGAASLVFIAYNIRRAYEQKPASLRVLVSLWCGHGGIALLVIAIAINAFSGAEKDMALSRGEKISINEDYCFVYNRNDITLRKNYISRQAEFFVLKECNAQRGTATPEVRTYPIEGTQTYESAIFKTLVDDYVLVIGNESPEGVLSTKLYYRPMMRIIWLAAVLIALGCALSLIRRKKE